MPSGLRLELHLSQKAVEGLHYNMTCWPFRRWVDPDMHYCPRAFDMKLAVDIIEAVRLVSLIARLYRAVSLGSMPQTLSQ